MKNHRNRSIPGGQLPKNISPTGSFRTHIVVHAQTHTTIRELAFKESQSLSGMIEILLREALTARGLL